MTEKKKTILVTGGAGFVGSHLVERLVSDGHRVISLDNYYAGSPENHVPGAEYIEGHTKDISDLVDARPDVVFHLGEYARVEKSFEDVEDVYDLNKVGTFAVLEFARRHGAKLVYAGSSTKFADGGEGKHQSPYAWTKATNTELVKNYGEWYGLDYAIAYFYNVFGGRERGTGPYATLIGIFKEEYRRGHPLTVVLPGTQKRNFTHVDDIVEGLILVGEKGRGDNFGIGNEESYSIMEVASLFDSPIVTLPERPGNRMSASVESQRTKELGWSAKRSLRDDLALFRETAKRGESREERILVLSTTFHPTVGPAERALISLMKKMPGIRFDVISAKLDPSLPETEEFAPNVTVHRLGKGNVADKYLLPIRAKRKAMELTKRNSYLFLWSLLASYAAIAGARLKRETGLPLLITLGDHRIDKLPLHLALAIRTILGNADQVYATDKSQVEGARSLGRSIRYASSLGSGDAFANQIRFVYTDLLRKGTK